MTLTASLDFPEWVIPMMPIFIRTYILVYD